jgi:hypothetical protein
MRLRQYFRARYGGNHEPVCAGTTRRFNPWTGAEVFSFNVPLTDIPTTYGQNTMREASPTGKSGVGYVTGSVAMQHVEYARSTFFNMDTKPIYAGDAALVTQGVVNPWDSLNVEKLKKRPSFNVGTKWRG